MPPGLRSFFEPRLGSDLSRVRLHTGAEADRAVRAVGGAAFTLGSDIAFASGRYAPGTAAGRGLLAHELAHAVQQRGAPTGGAVRRTRRGDRAEREASAAARALLADRPFPALARTGLALARGFGDDETPKPRSSGLTEAEWSKIKAARKYYNLPPRPTKSKPTIVGVLITEDGKEMFVKSGEHGGDWGGTHRGGIPRGEGEGFTGGGSSQGNIASHVEGHSAAIMHQQGIKKATLLIEEEPCFSCDSTKGWDAEKGSWAEPGRRRATPTISRVLPPGSKLTVVDPNSTGHYSSDKPAPRVVPRVVPGEEGTLGRKSPARNTPPETLPRKGGALPGGKLPRGGPKLPETGGPKLSPKTPRAGGKLGPRVLKGAGNIALDLVLLVATVIWELVVVPKINAWLAELQEQRRKDLERQIQAKFDQWEAKQIGRIVKWCWVDALKKIEQAGKQAYVNVELYVTFEDTSGRFQILHETPPESLFDLELYDVDLKNVWVSEKGKDSSVGELERCDDCGAMGRSRSFMGNNKLWRQVVTFSFEAPKAEEFEKEFEKEPELTDCLAAYACFIATACYGTPFAPEVAILRRFRDRWLATNRPGRLFVRAYYAASPPAARWIARHPRARRHVRDRFVGPLARTIRRLGLDGARAERSPGGASA